MNITYHQKLLADTPPAPPSSFGAKPIDLEARRAEARRLSQLMNEKRPFCYLRLGDMDLSYLLAIQAKELDAIMFDDGPINGTTPYCNPGIGPKYSDRFYTALSKSEYVDFYDRRYPNIYWVSRLKPFRSETLYRNPDIETSVIILTWLEYEFKNYCQKRKIGIAGAEACLLELLTKQPQWQEVARPYWPCNAEIYFHQVRDDGRNLDENLDLIKKDLAQFIEQNQIDTLFLSLGGGAKILCYELSRQYNICAFDFGAMLRALTYSGSDGNRASRSPHLPFLFRIPFDVFMTVLEQAFPSLTSQELLAKAHAQLILEVQYKEVGWLHPAREYDFSKENTSWFHHGYKIYLKRYRHLAYQSPDTRKELKDFLFFCGINKLTFEGRIYYLLFRIKSKLRRVLTYLRLLR